MSTSVLQWNLFLLVSSRKEFFYMDIELPASLKLTLSIVNSIPIIISMFGFLGNGKVIHLLGFHIEKNPFTTCTLNLSIADFGVFTSFLHTIGYIDQVDTIVYIYLLVTYFFLFMYNTGQYLLTAISMERCVSVIFPLWHRCHRPPHFSTLVCATIWITSFLLTVICIIIVIFRVTTKPLFYLLLMNAILCLPLMTVSTLVLFIKVCFRSQQRNKGKALTAILLALLFFLFLAFPFTFYVSYCYYFPHLHSLMLIGFGCSSVNSSINPIIYFLVGRRGRKSPSRVSMRAAISRVFKDVGDCTEDKKSRTESKVMI
uniref:G-protein coupled receptors family 1 profile domain-containing protein n=1 Tax=Podarcis muralis TaxID=64176 RepID=A0A670IG43_PODMU